nr:hypothetical protein [Helicobacter pylori]
MQTLKNKAFRVSIQWNVLVRKLLSLERGTLTRRIALYDFFDALTKIFNPFAITAYMFD